MHSRSWASLPVAAAIAALFACGPESGSSTAPDGLDCIPSCEGRSCGSDGCGGSCGTCAPGERCSPAFTCVPVISECVPNCEGRSCGDDGCGGSCGACRSGTSCVEGRCASPSCPGEQRCLARVHMAWKYECTRPTSSSPWTCEPQWVMAERESEALCRIECAYDLSTCGDLAVTDEWMVAECLACEASCREQSMVTCAGEAPGVCPPPCACE